MTSDSKLQQVEATVDELQRWWQDAVTQRSDALSRAERAEAALAERDASIAALVERKEFFRQCWEVAEAELAAMKTPCVWSRVGIYLGSACGYLTTLTADEFLFCPGCGHPVQVAE